MLQSKGLLTGNPDPVKLHPFRCQMELKGLKTVMRWAGGSLAVLGKLARAMGYLVSYPILSLPVVRSLIAWGLVRRVCRNVLRCSQGYE